jgi:dipeptidyl aminopeptidase/acylaminoacyl peptidase
MSFKKTYTIDQFMRTTKVLGGAFSSDDQSIVFTSNGSGVFNVYSASVRGDSQQQLTHSLTDNVYGLSYFPDNKRILISRDRGGNENYHLYAFETDGQELDLTPGDDVAARFYGPTPDGAAFYCATNERDRRCFDIYKINFDTLERERLFADTEGYDFGCISRDERYIAFGESHTREKADIFLYDRATKELRCLTKHEGNSGFWPSCFDWNSEYLYYQTNRDSDFHYVERVELATGKTEPIAKADCDCYFSFSPAGRYQIVSRDQDSVFKVDISCLASMRKVSLPEVASEGIAGLNFSRSGRMMAFYVDGDRSPKDLYIYDFSSRVVRRLTESLTPEIDASDLVDSETVHYRSFDGLEITALLWKPHNASVTNKVPALVYVHGGPGGQTRKKYNARIQFLVNNGYAVLAPNYRGSSGYGKTFRSLDNGTHGQAPLLDCVEARRYLATLDYIAGEKIGILGGSYGGFLAVSALTFYPEDFAAGIDLFGPTNWQRTLESFPPYWESALADFYRKVGDPRTEAEILRKISPLFHAEAITKPLLVLQGANDPRVLKSESDQIVAAIRKKGGVVEYIVFDDEGHGFIKTKNQTHAYKAIVEFLDRYLRS